MMGTIAMQLEHAESEIKRLEQQLAAAESERDSRIDATQRKLLMESLMRTGCTYEEIECGPFACAVKAEKRAEALEALVDVDDEYFDSMVKEALRRARGTMPTDTERQRQNDLWEKRQKLKAAIRAAGDEK